MPVSAAHTSDPVPHHGDRGEATRGPRFPRTLTVAVGRQSGARGGALAQRVGRKLGWQVVDQGLLEYMAQKGMAVDGAPEAARAWAEARLAELREAGILSDDPVALALARAELALG